MTTCSSQNILPPNPSVEDKEGYEGYEVTGSVSSLQIGMKRKPGFSAAEDTHFLLSLITDSGRLEMS